MRLQQLLSRGDTVQSIWATVTSERNSKHGRPTPKRIIIASISALTALLALAPAISASAPNSRPVGQPHAIMTMQDAQWLKAKQEYRVVSGIIVYVQGRV